MGCVMSFSLIPDYHFRKITDIMPDFLKSAGISLLLLDLDNTIMPYGVTMPDPSFSHWVSEMQHEGITLYIVSNSHGTRPETLSKAFGIEFINRAGKPSRRGILKAIEQTGRNKAETALVGDQIYTDVLAANRSGITSLMVQPISLKNPLLAVRYVLEIPFRLMRRQKMW